MKLQSGKTYLDRNGNKVTVKESHCYSSYTLEGTNGFHYAENGTLYRDDKSSHDLIEECNPFEIGEELEFGDFEDSMLRKTRILRAYCPEDYLPYKTSGSYNYKYARRPKTKMTLSEIEEKLDITNLEVVE